MNYLKHTLLGCLLIGLSTTTFADKHFSCDTVGLQNAEPLIEDMIDRIQTIGKIRQRYHVCRISYSTAVATIINKKRVIAYNSTLLHQLASIAGEQHWGRVVALSHEIGHHIFRHTDRIKKYSKLPRAKRLTLSRQYELQADEFAGRVAANMGASLANTQAIIKLLKLHRNEVFSTHPDVRKRVAAVTRGWNIGCQQAGKICNSPKYRRNNTPAAKKNRRAPQSPLGRKATANYSVFMQQAESLKGKRVNQHYCNRYAGLAVLQTKRSQQYHCGFNIAKRGQTNSQWSLEFAPQAKWCMKASAYATSAEAKFREAKLASCIR